MSLSDKYGGNDDIEKKYRKPEPPKPKLDPEVTPVVRKGYEDGYIPTDLCKDIREANFLKPEYIKLIEDAEKYLDKRKLMSSWDAAYNSKRRQIDDHVIQVYSRRLSPLLLPLNVTTEVYECGDWFETILSSDAVSKMYWKYYPLESKYQKNAIININAGTYCTFYEDGPSDIDRTQIVFFNDGNIFSLGSKGLHNIPIDYLAKVLDECIDVLNKTEEGIRPRVNMHIKFEKEDGVKDLTKNRKYFLKRWIY